jgi:hypothetical protein
LVLLPLDRIKNPPVALETWPEGYEKEGKTFSSSALMPKQLGLGRAKTSCKREVSAVVMNKKIASSIARSRFFLDLKYA